MSRADLKPGDRVFVTGVSDGYGFGDATILAVHNDDVYVRYDHYRYSDGQDGGWGPEKLDYHTAYTAELTLLAPSQSEVDAAIASITKTALERNHDG